MFLKSRDARALSLPANKQCIAMHIEEDKYSIQDVSFYNLS